MLKSNNNFKSLSAVCQNSVPRACQLKSTPIMLSSLASLFLGEKKKKALIEIALFCINLVLIITGLVA